MPLSQLALAQKMLRIFQEKQLQPIYHIETLPGGSVRWHFQRSDGTTFHVELGLTVPMETARMLVEVIPWDNALPLAPRPVKARCVP